MKKSNITNDEIFKLAKESSLIQFQSIPGSNLKTPDHESVANARKFALKIIEECAKVADENFGSAHFGLGVSGKMLKDHFGVE